MKTIHRTLLGLISLVLLSACSSSNNNKLTETLITELQQAITNATLNEDIASLTQLLAEDAVFELSIATPQGSKKKTMNRAEYIRSMEEGWRTNSSQGYDVDVKDIQIDASGKTAIVRSVVTETITMLGQRINSRTDETTHVAFMDGKPVVTRVIAAAVFDLAR